jgi:hypothetical protein
MPAYLSQVSEAAVDFHGATTTVHPDVGPGIVVRVAVSKFTFARLPPALVTWSEIGKQPLDPYVFCVMRGFFPLPLGMSLEWLPSDGNPIQRGKCCHEFQEFRCGMEPFADYSAVTESFLKVSFLGQLTGHLTTQGEPFVVVDLDGD